MQFRTPLLTLLLVAGFFAVPHIAQASIPFFGPIIPQAGNGAVCPASWGMLIDVINRIIQFIITLAIVFVAPIMIAYAGFLFVVNPVNASGKEHAKKILTNTVVGIVITLSAWLIVDAIMAVLTPNGKPFGEKWTTIISAKGDSPCLDQKGSLPGDQLNQVK